MSEKWYAIRVEPGRENTVAEALRLDGDVEKDRPSLRQYLSVEGCDMVMPVETSYIFRLGAKIEVCRPMLPGYIFRRMEMTDDAYHDVRRVPGVIGWLPAAKPFPIKDGEIKRLVERCTPTLGESAFEQDIGWMVHKRFFVIEGPFTSFQGECIRVDGIERKAVMLVEIFGRLTPVEMHLSGLSLEHMGEPLAPARKQDVVAPNRKKRYTAGISKRRGRARSGCGR